MKSVLVIGMGRFGSHLAIRMQELGNDVMVIDKDPEVIEPLAALFDDVQIGDCTNEIVMRSLGIENFDVCFVTIGDLMASLEITSILKELGAKQVIAQAKKERQAEFLRKIGADEVLLPDREIAERTAIRYNDDNIFNALELTSEYSIYEIHAPKEWIGKSISELDVRNKYKINIIAINKGGVITPAVTAHYVFTESEHPLVIGKTSDVFKLTAHK